MHVRSCFVRLCAVLVFAALGAGQVAQAAKLPDFKQTGVTVTGNSATLGMTGGGTAWGSAIPISPVVGGWSYAGNYGIPQAAKGTTMNLGASGDVFFSGTKYPFQAGYTVPASAMWDGLASAAAVLGGAAGGYIGLAALVASVGAPYIKQWFDESNLRVKPDDPTKIQHASDLNYCNPGPCYEWRGAAFLPWKQNAAEACQAHSAHYNKYYFGTTTPAPNGNADCGYRNTPTGAVTWFRLLQQTRPPSTVRTWDDIPSLADIAPYMKQTPFDPRVLPEILTSGGDVPMGTPTITGPTSLPGPSQVVKNPDGSTTTINTTNNYQIDGNKITNISNVTSTTITNSSSVVIGTSSTSVTPSPTNEQTDVCKLYPDSLGCAKFGTPEAADQLGRQTQTVTITPVAFTGGTCPAPVTFAALGRSYEFSYDTLCGKLASLSTLFLALASFAAAWIFASGFKV